MKYMYGDIWELSNGFILCVTTNCVLKKNGEAVMGKGIALEASIRYPELPKLLGDLIIKYSNPSILGIFQFEDRELITFPTKKHWRQKSNIRLIEHSMGQLKEYISLREQFFPSEEPQIFLPQVGCGNGGLSWKDEVEPLLSKYLDDRFVLVIPDFKEVI